MKAFISTLRISLLAVLLGTTTVHAQWNTLNHDATVNRSINDIFFLSSTGYAAGWRADAVSWGTRGLLYKTTDGGQTWSTITVPLVIGTDSVQGFKSIHFTSPATGYAASICYSTNNVSGIYYGALLKTTDGGQTWTSLYSMKSQINWSNGNTTHFDHITFSDQYTGFISGWRNLGVNTYDGLTFTTYNGGNTWVQNTAFTGTGTQAHASYFESNGTGSVAGGKPMGLSGPYNGRIARSTNWGNTWNVTFIDNDYSYVDIHFPVGQVGYAVGDSMYNTTAGASNGKLVKTTNGGISWSQQALFTNFKPLCVFFTSATEGYIGGETAAGNAAIRKTTDGGVTWTNEVYPDIATASLVTSIHFSTPVTGYASNSWTNSNSVYGAFLSSTCAVFAGPDTSFCQSAGQIFATPATPGNDYVYSWSPATGLSDPNAQAPFVSQVSNQQYVVTMTDTVTNCTATDTIVVSAYSATFGPEYFCPGDSVMLDLGPGGTNYYWQMFTDTDNVTTFLSITTQTLWVDEPGYYMAYATFPGCGTLTSNIQVIDSCVASSNCWNLFTYQHNPYTCGDSVLFVGTGNGIITSWTWDMGDGNTYSGPTLSMLYHNYTAGTYTVTLTTVDNNNCTAVSSLTVTVTAGVSVNAGADTTFCQQQGQLSATPGTPGNYTFMWSPANGLDNPNAQNPNVISGVSNQQYVVTMTDTSTGCTATDTVIVSAYYFHMDTVFICDSSNVTLDLGPGATYYYWQYYTDTAGNTSIINVYTQTLSVNQPGQYLAIAGFPGCGVLTSIFTVIDSCNVYVSDVWPGDCNYDLVANMADALHIGLGYGATDATRPNASPLWYPQPMNDWTQSFTNCNYKHADANGDGVINVSDTLPISLNYGNTHPFRLGQPEFIASAPTLTLVANYDTVGLQTLVTIDVQLGSAALPVDSLYGISFRITADAGLIDTTLTVINLNSTWLGTMGGNLFGFRKSFPGGGRIDVAESRNDHMNRLNGSGTIATFSIVTTDNLSGIAVCHIDVTDVTAVTASQHYLPVNIVNDSVVINSAAPAGISRPEPSAAFALYPNPANEQVTVQTGAPVSRIEICDMLGRTVQSVSPATATTVINTSALAEGVYLVRVYSGNAVSTQKLTVTR